MDLELLPIFVIGIIGGIATGIMPGIGPAHLLALTYTWMTGWDPVQLIVFYITYITISNFVDSIPSLYLGIPGEVSAIPASRESQRLNQLGLVSQTIRLAALGRTFGSFFALSTSVVLITWLLNFPEIFASRYQIIFYCITIVCIAIAGRNSWWMNLIFMIAGLIISSIGYNYYTEKTYLTGEWADLYSGIPLLPLLIGIYVIPQLLSSIDKPKILESKSAETVSDLYLPSMLRGTSIGYFLGLIPGMSYILGSTAAYNFERWWHQRSGSKKDISVASVVASETASNTGSMTVLIPLLLFGMPIITSEAIIYDLMVNSGAVFSMGKFLTDNYYVLAQWFVGACVIGLLISWPLAKYLKNLSLLLLDRRIIWILISLTLATIGLEAYQLQKILLYALVLTISFIVGWVLRHRDVMPLVFVFVLGNSFQNVIYNLLQLYF